MSGKRTKNECKGPRLSKNVEQPEPNRDPTVNEQNASANSCTAGVQSISETQAIPHCSTAIEGMFPVTGMQQQQLIPPDINKLGLNEYGGATRQESLSIPAGEVMILKSCTLYPPSPFTHFLPFQPKPVGCNKIVVLNLPEMTTKEMIEEIFLPCGTVLKIVMNSVMFCHVCFTSEDSVDRALSYSGYVMMTEDKERKVYHTRTVFVDYATSIDSCALGNFYQRYFSSVHPYSKKEANHIIRKLKKNGNNEGRNKRDEHGFYESLHVLHGWLVRGECVRSNADVFFNMLNNIQQVSKEINVLRENYVHEKNVAEHKIEKQTSLQEYLHHFSVMSNFFQTVKQRKVFNQFTKGQQRSIEQLQKDFEELIDARFKELLNQCLEDSSINEDKEEYISKYEQLLKVTEKLMAEKQCLTQRRKVRQNVNENLANEIAINESRIEALRAEALQLAVDERNLRFFMTRQTHIIGLIAIFLRVHPLGASIDEICSYLQQSAPSLTASDIESLMKGFPQFFVEYCIDVGGSFETKWTLSSGEHQM